MSCLKSLLQRITFRGRCISGLQKKDLSSDSRGSIGRITLKGYAGMQQQLQVPDVESQWIYAIGSVQFQQN